MGLWELQLSRYLYDQSSGIMGEVSSDCVVPGERGPEGMHGEPSLHTAMKLAVCLQADQKGSATQ